MKPRNDAKSQVFNILNSELKSIEDLIPMTTKESIKKRIETPIRKELVVETQKFLNRNQVVSFLQSKTRYSKIDSILLERAFSTILRFTRHDSARFEQNYD